MKSKLGHLAMIATMLSLRETGNLKSTFEPQPIQPLPPKGKSFIIHGVETYALNQRNAWRKYKNLISKL